MIRANKILTVLLLNSTLWHSVEPHEGSEYTVTPGKDALQALRRENMALRKRIAEVEDHLDRCRRGHLQHREVSAPVGALGQSQYLNEQQDLPSGSYQSSCSECRVASEIVTCQCLQKASVTSSTIMNMPSENLTGTWVIPYAEGGRLAGQPQEYLHMVDEPKLNSTNFTLVCGKLPLDRHYAASCRAPGQSVGLGYKAWHRGNASFQAVRSGNRLLTVQLDNGWRGCAYLLKAREEDVVGVHLQPPVTQLQWRNCTTSALLHPEAENWTRLPDTGLLTSLWLPSCIGYADGEKLSENATLTNDNGLLSCRWRPTPPPRVGNLTTRGFGDAAHTCRILSSYTFLSPQYKAPGDPLATYSLLNDENKSAAEILKGSTWTSFTADRTLVGDTFELIAASVDATVVPTAANTSLHRVVCTAGGPDPSNSCNPYGREFDGRGIAGRWNTANLSISLVPSAAGLRSASVYFDLGGALFSHSLSGALTTDYRQIDWTNGERWVRVHPNQLGECCDKCVAYGEHCKGWVVEPAAGSCSLVSTVATAYPSLAAIAGYPMQSDAASYCTSMFSGEGEPGQPWADEHLTQGTTCGSIRPQYTLPALSTTIRPTRPWTDSSGRARGTAWLFYPGHPAVRALPQNLTDLWTSSSCGLSGPCTPNHDILSIESDPTLGTFTITCRAAGPSHHCTPSGGIPIRPNEWHTGLGLVDWATREITVHFDDSLVFTGTASANYDTIKLHNLQGGLTLHRTAQCSCHCADEPDCSTMDCVGPDLSASFNGTFASSHVRGQRWAVFVHGGVFRLYNPIDGNYAMLMSKLAGLGSIGVLGVDYRTTDAQPSSEGVFPNAVNDIIDAIGWLQTAGASAVTLVGDSSGGTIVVQTLLELARRKHLQIPAPRVEGAVTFSAWLDLSDSSPSYHSNRWCRAECDGVGAQAFHMDPGVGQLKSMCDAMKYAGKNLSVSDPRLSPVQASSALLALLPPIMLVIGGNEQLLGENLEFAQIAQAAGAHVQVEVFDGMWHDFVQESEGCGSGEPLVEAQEALLAAATFLNATSYEQGGCMVQCDRTSIEATLTGEDDTDGKITSDRAIIENGQRATGGATVVHWHYRYNYKPPATQADCRDIW